VTSGPPRLIDTLGTYSSSNTEYRLSAHPPGSWQPNRARSLVGGLLKEGYQADIHVLDLDKLEPRSKWVLKGSRKYSKGVFYVMVNGVFVLDDEKPTGKLPGAIIKATQAWSGN
jgi:hypothetical protein